MQSTIDQYKKLVNDLSNKNTSNLKNDKIDVQEEMFNIRGFKEKNNLKAERKTIQENNSKLGDNKMTNLIDEKQIFLNKENLYKSEIIQLTETVKKFKQDLRKELDEKIQLIKEFEKLRISQINFNENHYSLKNDVESAHEEIENLTLKINNLILEKEEINLKYNYNQIEFEEIKNQYSNLCDEYNHILIENGELKQNNINKNFSDVEIYKIIDKYEEESFNLKCENNQFKNLILEIINLQITNADFLQFSNILTIDENYLLNTPENIKIRMEKIFNYFKNLLFKDKQNYSVKMLADNLLDTQNFNNVLSIQIKNEIKLRRKFQNNYINLLGNFRIICRVRPFIYNDEKNAKMYNSFFNSYEISSDYVKLKDDKRPIKYYFDYVLNQTTTQEDLYGEISMLLESFLKGKNICVMAYGQNSTGKSFSISGKSKKNIGIAYRVIKEIFDIFNNKFNKHCNTNKNYFNNYQNNEYENEKLSNNSVTNNKYSNCSNSYSIDDISNTNDLDHNDLYQMINLRDIKSFKISLSIIEIYNENVYNLLAEGTPVLKIFENPTIQNLIIPDLNPIRIDNYDSAVKLFKLAKTFRKSKLNQYNKNGINNNDHSYSKRSHLIYTFYLKIEDQNGELKRSKFNIIDLAGCERLSKNEKMFQDDYEKKDSLNVNLSLNTLSNVLIAIANKNQFSNNNHSNSNSHIPFRESKLTHYLKDSLNNFERNFILTLLIHISPNVKDFADNISTLEFGNKLYRLCRKKINNK